MSDKIKHTGKVESIERNHIRVKIIQTSACSSCTVASHCNAAESKEKVIDVYQVSNVDIYNIGDDVTVSTSSKVGVNAVLLAFGVPFLVLIIFLILGYQLTHDEFTSAFIAIVVMLFYYFVLYFFRARLGEKFTFHIEKQ